MKTFQLKINLNGCTLQNSSHIFSSYNVSILIFQKMINKYNETFNRKIYSLHSENVAQNFVCLVVSNFLFQSARNIFNSKHLREWKF